MYQLHYRARSIGAITQARSKHDTAKTLTRAEPKLRPPSKKTENTHTAGRDMSKGKAYSLETKTQGGAHVCMNNNILYSTYIRPARTLLNIILGNQPYCCTLTTIQHHHKHFACGLFACSTREPRQRRQNKKCTFLQESAPSDFLRIDRVRTRSVASPPTRLKRKILDQESTIPRVG